MPMNNKVVILGCGHGGMALAAELTLKGAQVALWSHPNHASKLNKIISQNEIIYQCQHKTHTITLDLMTTDLHEALQFGNIIYNCTPMTAHRYLFKQLYLSLEKTRAIKIFINLSGVFSSIEQFLSAHDISIFNRLKIFDTSTFPFACRAGERNDVMLLGKKSELTVAPLFSKDLFYLNMIPDHCKPIKFSHIENTFKIGLMGTNATFHSATVLFNARLIDNACSFLFYKEGISKRTSLLHEALDYERITLAKTLGYTLKSCVEDDNKYYGTHFVNSYDFSTSSIVHKNVKSPISLNHRFVTEDVAYGLVPLWALGRLYNIKLANIESVIQIFSTLMGMNYFLNGRNLMGLTKEMIHDMIWPNKMSERTSA